MTTPCPNHRCSGALVSSIVHQHTVGHLMVPSGRVFPLQPMFKRCPRCGHRVLEEDCYLQEKPKGTYTLTPTLAALP